MKLACGSPKCHDSLRAILVWTAIYTVETLVGFCLWYYIFFLAVSCTVPYLCVGTSLDSDHFILFSLLSVYEALFFLIYTLSLVYVGLLIACVYVCLLICLPVCMYVL